MENPSEYEPLEEELELKALLMQLLKAPLAEMSSRNLEQIESVVESGMTTSSGKILARLADRLNDIDGEVSNLSDEIDKLPKVIKGALDEHGAKSFNEINHNLEKCLSEVNEKISAVEGKISEVQITLKTHMSSEVKRHAEALDSFSAVENKSQKHFVRIYVFGFLILIAILANLGLNYLR